MSTYEDEDFQELKELVEENNKILRSLQKKARWATGFAIVRWSVVIAIAIGLFTILQPILDNLMDAYRVLMDNFTSFNGARESVSSGVDISGLVEIFNQDQ
jgi:hypothetical protein